jgi:hypothetical protein
LPPSDNFLQRQTGFLRGLRQCDKLRHKGAV